MALVGDIIIIVGTIFMLFGVIGIFRFRRFYPRILVVAKIDTVGALTVAIGVIVRQGLSFFSFRTLLLLVLLLVINPMVTYVIGRSAYLSGYREEDTHDTTDTKH
ncbi:MAG: monovalent cation/H(+) antiporter subunit G [Oscillospiraceae bacterium]|nr:monovalent cation/H(+) antiporter subunit G [Oscillospiraceae bacterium]